MFDRSCWRWGREGLSPLLPLNLGLLKRFLSGSNRVSHLWTLVGRGLVYTHVCAHTRGIMPPLPVADSSPRPQLRLALGDSSPVLAGDTQLLNLSG